MSFSTIAATRLISAVRTFVRAAANPFGARTRNPFAPQVAKSGPLSPEASIPFAPRCHPETLRASIKAIARR